MDYKERSLSDYKRANPMSNDLDVVARKPKPKSRKQLLFEAYSHDINRAIVPADAAFTFRAQPVVDNSDQFNPKKEITDGSLHLQPSGMGVKNLDVSNNVYRVHDSGYDYDYRIPYKTEDGRSKSPNILIDLVITTPQNELKINRKCKNYEIGIFT
jgi:hypothetical protein